MTVIHIPLLFGSSGGYLGMDRNLWSENCKDNGIVYSYCTSHCCPNPYHCGVDIDTDGGAGVQGRPEALYAIADGTVMFAGSDGYYCPLHVDLKPTVGPYQGHRLIHGHMSSVNVSTGQVVKQGDFLGYSGDPYSCGQCSTWCAHVHFEQRDLNDCSIDPIPTLQDANPNGGSGPPDPNPTPPPPQVSFVKANVAAVSQGPLNLRSSPSTSATIIGSLANNQTGVVIGGPTTASGYTWYQWRTKLGDGWSAANWMVLATNPKDWSGDPAVSADLHNIFPNRTSSPLTYLAPDNGHDAAVKSVGQGTQTYEGLRFESGTSPLGLTVARTIVAVVDVYGSGTLDWLTCRATQSDGTAVDSAHPAAVTLNGSWQTVVLPALAIPPAGKTTNLLQIHVVGSAATARTIHADNGHLWELV